MDKTLIVWRRLGKEHGETSGFKLNPPDVVAAHLQSKIDLFKETPEYDWRWWQASPDLLIEKPFPSTACDESSVIYYLPKRNWVIVENMNVPPELGDNWIWYVHLGSIQYDEAERHWVFTDLMVDIVIDSDRYTHSVLDLDDLAEVFQLGLVDSTQMAEVLRSTQEMVDLIRAGEFPPEEIRNCQDQVASLG